MFQIDRQIRGIETGGKANPQAVNDLQKKLGI